MATPFEARTFVAEYEDCVAGILFIAYHHIENQNQCSCTVKKQATENKEIDSQLYTLPPMLTTTESLSLFHVFIMTKAQDRKNLQPCAKMIQKATKILPNQRLNLPNPTVDSCKKHIARCIVQGERRKMMNRQRLENFCQMS